MKKIYLFFNTLIALSFSPAKAQVSLESQLRNFPIENYLNKPIDSLLNHLPPGFDPNFKIGEAGDINTGATLQVNYGDNIQYWGDIKIKDPQFITVKRDVRYTSAEIAWPLNLLRKEKVGSIDIFTGAYILINSGYTD